MSPLMLYDPIRGIPKPYPSEAVQFREYTKHESWFYNPFTGERRDPADIAEDPVGIFILPPNTEGEPLEPTNTLSIGLEHDGKTGNDSATADLSVQVGDAGKLSVDGSVDEKGDVYGGVRFTYKL